MGENPKIKGCVVNNKENSLISKLGKNRPYKKFFK